MSCDICIGANDYHGDELILCEREVASSFHKCCECFKEIEPGQEYMAAYEYYSDCEGENCGSCIQCSGTQCREDFSTCLVCAEIRQVYSCGGMQLIGGLWEQMDDWWDEFTMAGECWQQLSAASKAEMVRRWQEYKGLDRLEVGK